MMIFGKILFLPASTASRFRVIARGVIPDTSLMFRRRPATDAIAYVMIHLEYFQFVFGLVYRWIWVRFKCSVFRRI